MKNFLITGFISIASVFISIVIGFMIVRAVSGDWQETSGSPCPCDTLAIRAPVDAEWRDFAVEVTKKLKECK